MERVLCVLLKGGSLIDSVWLYLWPEHTGMRQQGLPTSILRSKSQISLNLIHINTYSVSVGSAANIVPVIDCNRPDGAYSEDPFQSPPQGSLWHQQSNKWAYKGIYLE